MAAPTGKIQLLMALEVFAMFVLVLTSSILNHMGSEYTSTKLSNENILAISSKVDIAKHILASYSENRGPTLGTWAATTAGDLESELNRPWWREDYAKIYGRENTDKFKTMSDLAKSVVVALREPNKVVSDAATNATVNEKLDALATELRDVRKRQADSIFQYLTNEPLLNLVNILAQVAIPFIFALLARALNAVLSKENPARLNGKLT